MLRGLSAAALLIALAYIVHLRRELAQARSRGDMYRDIAAQLDRQRAQPSPPA
jgi:hypothetical protein